MKETLLSIIWRDQIVGSASIKVIDPTMGIAEGFFIPTAIFTHIQPIFEIFHNLEGTATTSEYEKYYEERDKLQLSIRKREKPISCNWIHIVIEETDLRIVIQADGESMEAMFSEL